MNVEPEFSYEISVRITFTVAELRVLRDCAAAHYDYKCEHFFDSGNTGMVWRNSFPPIEGEDIDPFDESAPPDHVCYDHLFATFDTLDFVSKILERGHYLKTEDEAATALQLGMAVRKALRAINTEWARCSGKGMENTDPALATA